MFGLLKKSRQLKEIKSYGLDWRFFSEINNLPLFESPIEHFISNWENQSFIIPGVMDTGFYLEQNPDVYKAKVNPLIHYIRSGRLQRRPSFKTSAQLFDKLNDSQIQEDVSILNKEDVDWHEYAKAYALSSKEESVWHYATFWPSLQPTISTVFNTQFYLACNPDIHALGVNPLIHYLTEGKAQGRHAESQVCKGYQIPDGKMPKMTKSRIQDDSSVLNSIVIPWNKYIEKFNLASRKDAILHYCTYWPILLPNVGEFFSTAYYVELRPEVWTLNQNPLIHYIKFGKTEGMMGLPEKIQPSIPIQSDQINNKPSGKHHSVDTQQIVPSVDEANETAKTENAEFVATANDEVNESDSLAEASPSTTVDQEQPVPASLSSAPVKEVNADHSLHIPVSITALDNATIQHDYTVIASQGINWDEYIQQYNLASGEDAVAHYVTNWQELLPVIRDVFDTKHYLSKYPDIDESGMNPLVHFFTSGEFECREALPTLHGSTLSSQTKAELTQSMHDLGIDWSNFEKINNIQQQIDEPIHYILRYCETMNIKLPGVFDSEFYLSIYPDIGAAGANPLLHFLLHGHREGRIGYYDAKKHFKLGSHKFDKNKELIAVVCHESSATGAPLVGYNLAYELAEQYNVVNIILRKSKLQDAFESECVASLFAPFNDYHFPNPLPSIYSLKYIEKQLKPINGLICNSVETIYILQAARKMNIPTVSLVHEYSEYTKPTGKISRTVFSADRVIVPARVIRESACRDMNKYLDINSTPNNIVVQPQGKLNFIPEGQGKLESTERLLRIFDIGEDRENFRIIVGAGFVHIRKGLDLFIATAKRIKDLCKYKCKFVWVGEGYDPENDLAYANWVQSQISLCGLKDDVVFLGHQRNLDNVMSIADVFLMTSRMDPFPNVVIDALSADVHVGCFEQSTGCAEFLQENESNSTVVEYLDTEQLGQGVSHYLNSNDRKPSINKKLVAQKLNFSSYTEKVKQELELAKKARKQNQQNIQELADSGLFYPEYYNPNLSESDAIDEYVNLASKGIHIYNPAPGFNELVAIASNSTIDEYTVPLLEAHNKNILVKTHTCHKLDDEPAANAHNEIKYAVHLHLFYAVLIDEFVEYFMLLPKGFDLYITYVEEKLKDDMTAAFSECGANKVILKKVKNIGRDIGPLFIDLKSDLLFGDYDVIGHFHSKKSFDASEELGDRWRTFLLKSLIGNKKDAAKVLQLFNNPEIGMVFPEDQHCVGEGQNRKYIKSMCDDLKIAEPSYTHIFPIGTMFWSKVAAIKPLFESDFGKYVQPEPLPYDGSYMHSVERLLPVVCTSTGYQVVTVYKDGVSW